MTDQTKNVFISHIHEDDDGLTHTKNLLGKNGFTIRDSSVNSSNPNEAQSEEYIKNKILAPKINWASTLIVYITPDTKDSKWVNWEIEYAHKMDKRIVGIWAHGENECEMPEALDLYGDAVVGWNSGKIIDAITGKINEFDNPSGTICTPRPIRRIKCG